MTRRTEDILVPRLCLGMQDHEAPPRTIRRRSLPVWVPRETLGTRERSGGRGESKQA